MTSLSSLSCFSSRTSQRNNEIFWRTTWTSSWNHKMFKNDSRRETDLRVPLSLPSNKETSIIIHCRSMGNGFVIPGANINIRDTAGLRVNGFLSVIMSRV